MPGALLALIRIAANFLDHPLMHLLDPLCVLRQPRQIGKLMRIDSEVI